MNVEQMNADVAGLMNQIGIKDLEKMLAERKKAESKERAHQKSVYEKERNDLAVMLVDEAEKIALILAEFHEKAKTALLEFREKSREYGGVRANSKGGYSIEVPIAGKKATLRFHAIWAFDERAAMAEELLKEFLAETVKKRDKSIYEILMSLLERNTDGKLEPRRVMEIIKHEEKFEDERWVQAIRLLKESYHEQTSKYYMEFAKKDEDGKWQPMNLNFSSI